MRSYCATIIIKEKTGGTDLMSCFPFSFLIKMKEFAGVCREQERDEASVSVFLTSL